MVVRAAVARWPLVERERELGAFETAWDRRSCQGMVLVGAAGVGKSRLADECLTRAVRAGFKGRRATASTAASAVPLGAVAHLVPARADLSDPVRGFARVAQTLAGPERAGRWAVLVDDAHLLDPASAVLLRQLMDAGLVRLIGTVRADEPTNEAVSDLCGGAAVARIDLDAFNPAQTAQVLRAALGGPVSRRTVHELFVASGGNALYLRELVTGALTNHTLAFDGEIWDLAERRTAATPRLSELITARLATADPNARGVLELLALCEPLPLADVHAAAGDRRTVTALEETGLIHVTTQRHRDTVILAHPLYGETLRARLGALRRRELLRAQVDRTRAHGSRRREDPLRTAAWLLAATGTADPALLIQAAALARYAHDYPRVRTLLRALPETANTGATRLMLGEALFEVGDWEGAEQALQDADAHAQDDEEVIAVTLARSFSLFWSAGRTAEALAVNDAALARVTSASGLRTLRHNEGCMRIASGQPSQGLELLDAMEDDILDAPDPAAWLAGAMMKPVGLEMTGRGGEAVAFAEHAYAEHLKVADRALYPHPASQLISLSYALHHVGRLAEARDVGERGYAELTANHIIVPTIWMAMCLAELEWQAGHPTTARHWFADAANQARASNSIRGLRPALSGVAACAAILGDPDTADLNLAEARRYPPLEIYDGLEHQASAWTAAARGDANRARDLLTDAATRAHARGMITWEARLLADAARLGGARHVAPRLAELAQECDAAPVTAFAHLAAALAAHAPDRLMEVAREWERIGADLLAAEAATAAAAAYTRAGQTHKATIAAQFADNRAAHCEGARTPPLTTTHTAASLTTRERDIALLAAHGTPSKDIADTLRLSVRTVDNHLQHAYTKLGVTTRRELAKALGVHTTPTTDQTPCSSPRSVES